MAGGMVHINMGRGKRAKKAPPACRFHRWAKDEDGTRRRVYCLCITTRLCDWPGCDAPMCDEHALALADNLDVCPTHNHRRGLLSRLLPPPTKETP
jgi:hypothetical protein